MLLTTARALLEQGHHAAAAAMFQRCAASDPERPDGWIGQANVALAEGRPSVAIAACDEGLKTCPDNQGLVLKRALGLQRVGRPLEAIDLLKAQVQRHPKRVVFRNALARAHAAAGETVAAGAIYEQVISEMPRNRGALMGRVDLALVQSDFQAAQAACDAALDVFPDDPVLARKQARILVGLGRHREAVALLERLKRQGASGAAADAQLARAHLASGAPDRAEALFREILEADPGNDRAVLALADIAEKRGDAEGALALMERSLQAKS
jgi:predicted Zn-dependent protease